MIRLFLKGEETYRKEVLMLETWSSGNNLALDTKNTKEIIIDFRRCSADPAPLYIDGECAARIQTFHFLGDLISADLLGTDNIPVVIKKTQQGFTS